MLIRTHIAFVSLLIILFVTHVTDKFVFMVFALIGAVIPDIDTGFSTWGKHFIFKPIQFFLKHRTMIHSLTFGILITILIAAFFPVLSFGFFLGFASHLLLDSFTKDGILPFWPLSYKSSGFISTGRRIEGTFFITLIAIDLLIIAFYLIF